MDEHPQHRATTMACHGLVTAPHALAAQAGLAILRAGGNAVDAAIAANATLQVVFPFVVGLGGDLFLLLYDAPSRQLIGLNASGRAPAAATIEHYRALGYAAMPRFGIHSVTVPGCVDGWATASARFGRLGLGRVLQPAIAYAEEGFPVGPALHGALTRMRTDPRTHHSFLENYLPDGMPPAVGSIARAPALARTLRAVAAEGAAAFYRGAIAERIATFFAQEGGLITLEDLARHHSDWVTPLGVPFAGMRVYELPPNTQGITALQILGMLDTLTLGESPLSARTIHLTVEAKKLAFADRAAHLTDLEHMRTAPEALIAPAYLRQRAAEIDAARARDAAAPAALRGDTIALCAADGDGSVVSLIQSNYMGFGSGYVVAGTGIALQNRGASFSLDPAAANALAPEKRPLHTLIPSLATRDGRPVMAFGSMGGAGQTTTHAQVYTAVARYGLNIQAAIEMPRWVHGAEDSPEEFLRVERRMPAATVAALRALGHDVRALGPWDSAVGHAHGIVLDQQSGVLQGGADPRAEGLAAGW